MRAVLLGREVRQFPTLAHAERLTDLRTSRIERTADVERRDCITTGLLVAIVRKLKTSLVDHRRVQNRGFSHLHVLIYCQRVVTTLGQRKALNAGVVDTNPVVVVTNYERVIRIDGVVKTRTQKKVATRHEKPFSDVN